MNWRWLKNNGLAIEPMKFVFIGLALVIVLLIFVPLFKMMVSSSPADLMETLLQGDVRGAIMLSLYTALLATAIGFLLGIPLAYLLARHEFRGKRIIEGLIDLPIVVPHTAAGIALLFVFGQNFFLGKVFHAIGIDFVGEVAGIVIAMLFVSIPFLVNSAKEGFKKVDVRLERVARSLGASPWQAFTGVTLPLARGSILSGTLMMWGRGISEFGAVLILVYNPMVAPVLVYQRLESFGLDYALPVAALLILVSLVIFVALRFLAYRWERK